MAGAKRRHFARITRVGASAGGRAQGTLPNVVGSSFDQTSAEF